MTSLRVRVDGLEELKRELEALSSDMSRKVLRSATGAAAQVIRKAARDLVPVDSGKLRKAIYIKHMRELSSSTQQEYYISVRNGPRERRKIRAGGSGIDAWYWKMVEFGTSKMPAKPFIRPAYESKKSEALEAMKKKLRQRIDAVRGAT